MKKLLILSFLSIFFSQIVFSQVSEKEKKLYQTTLELNNIESFNKFLKKYPNSEFSYKIREIKTFMQDSIEIVISTYLGNEKRNFYGNKAPQKLDTLYKI